MESNHRHLPFQDSALPLSYLTIFDMLEFLPASVDISTTPAVNVGLKPHLSPQYGSILSIKLYHYFLAAITGIEPAPTQLDKLANTPVNCTAIKTKNPQLFS